MPKRRGVSTRWSVLLDGAAWAGLLVLSGLALFDRVRPPWLLFVTWFSLHPGIALAYLASKWSSRYARYLVTMKSWIAATTYLWLYQTLFFAHHIATRGFAVDLELIDAGSAALTAGVALYVWFDAFWADFVGPYQLVRLGDVKDYYARRKKQA